MVATRLKQYRLPPVREYPQQHSPFFRLPAEARNAIYHSVLSVDGVEDGGKVRLHRNKLVNLQSNKSFFAILRTCRQIRGEAQGIFYAKYNFEITSIDHGLFHSSSPVPFIHELSPARLNAIRTLTLGGNSCLSRTMLVVEEVAKVCPPIEVLHVHSRRLEPIFGNVELSERLQSTLREALPKMSEVRELKILYPDYRNAVLPLPYGIAGLTEDVRASVQEIEDEIRALRASRDNKVELHLLLDAVTPG